MHVRSGTSEDCELLRIFFIKTTAFPYTLKHDRQPVVLSGIYFKITPQKTAQKPLFSGSSDRSKFNRSNLLCQPCCGFGCCYSQPFGL